MSSLDTKIAGQMDRLKRFSQRCPDLLLPELLADIKYYKDCWEARWFTPEFREFCLKMYWKDRNIRYQYNSLYGRVNEWCAIIAHWNIPKYSKIFDIQDKEGQCEFKYDFGLMSPDWKPDTKIYCQVKTADTSVDGGFVTLWEKWCEGQAHRLILVCPRTDRVFGCDMHAFRKLFEDTGNKRVTFEELVQKIPKSYICTP